ncbi:MAG: ZIP family metal transporter [Oscillospiraceae bacterium]|jgi:ZIP family zinc transporter|nr:ZIP family metal transporter [Oscillospiraceae bacterium]
MDYAVFCGLGFTFVMTCLGAATVFFFLKKPPKGAEKIFLGFAAGVMIAASVWSLLIPAIEAADVLGKPGWLPASVGFIVGSGFMYFLEGLISRLRPRAGESTFFKRTKLLLTAITLHNIPEGMAVGLAFALAAGSDDRTALLAPASALALGIGIQNIPEGAAVSLPLRQEGVGAWKAFILGCLSGAVEPVLGIMSFWAASWIATIMPWVLSFSAGAMIYVVVDELIPEAKGGRFSVGTISTLAGFLIMMILDVALG